MEDTRNVDIYRYIKLHCYVASSFNGFHTPVRFDG
jgi:hypothetical protein